MTMLTYAEMIEVAKRGGFVRWSRSGVYERLLFINTNRPGILAEGPITAAHFLRKTKTYNCVDVPRSTLIPIGELFWPSGKPRSPRTQPSATGETQHD